MQSQSRPPADRGKLNEGRSKPCRERRGVCPRSAWKTVYGTCPCWRGWPRSKQERGSPAREPPGYKAAMTMASQGWHRQCQGSQGAGGIARVNEHGALPKSGRRPRGACHRGWTSARVTRFAEPRDSESPGARGSVSRPSSELGQAVSFTSPRITPEEVRQRPELSLPPPPSNPPSSLPRGVCPGQAAREGRPHAPNKSRRP